MHSQLHSITSIYSYIDGGTGSMLLQAGLAGLVSGIFIIKTKWGQLVSKFSHKPSSDQK